MFMRGMCSWLVGGLIVGCLISEPAWGQPREEKVRNDRKKVEAEGYWIYNDPARAFDEAKQSGKPILMILRCIPCEECVKLDDDLIDKDLRVKPLLEKFTRLRVVSTNGLDLSLFQYDYDQSFAVFFLNADRTIYGRYGTRSHRTHWTDDVSVEGLALAMQGALDLHAGYPANRASLAGKTGPAPEFAAPEKFPMLAEKYTSALNYQGNVVQSCIHCHQIGDAQRQVARSRGAFTEELLFPYPHPKALGLVLDPAQRATVEKVEPKSPAEQAGFQPGDVLTALNGQPLLSLADVQWVLHHTPGVDGQVQVDLLRGGKPVRTTWKLPAGWRRLDDVSWRSSTWGLRRMATGGIVLEELPAEDRERLGLAAGVMALRAKHVGKFGAHAAAQRAGFKVGDVLTSFAGRTDLVRETDLLEFALKEKRPGQTVPVTVRRGDQTLSFQLPMQE